MRTCDEKAEMKLTSRFAHRFPSIAGYDRSSDRVVPIIIGDMTIVNARSKEKQLPACKDEGLYSRYVWPKQLRTRCC